MSTPAPHQKPTATPAGPTETAAAAQAFLADIESIMAARPMTTSFRNEDPDVPSWQDGSRIGTTPAITNQPGARRPAMSQAASDYSARVLSTAVASVLISASGSGLLIASEHANPTTLGLMVAAPAVLALPVLAFKSLMKSAKEVVAAAPPEIHQHYNGRVHQDNRQQHLHTKNAGVIAYTRNQPELPANSSHAPR